MNESALNYVTNKWSQQVVQPILIALLTTGLLTAVAVLLVIFTANNNWLRLPLLSFFITLEGIFTTLWLKHPEQRKIERIVYRAAELMVILLMTRLYTWFAGGIFPQWRLIATYLAEPFTFFADALFLVGVVLIILAWERGLTIARIFFQLSIDIGEASYYLLPKRERLMEDKRPFQRNRIGLINLFFKHWVIGAIILAGLAALSTFELTQIPTATSFFALGRLGLRPAMLYALLIYFLAGFLLLSQARLAAANARWLRDGVVKQPQVERSWHRVSGQLVLFIAFLTALLPIGSTNAIGRLLQSALGISASILSILYLLFIGLISMLMPQPNSAASSTPPPLALPTPIPPQTTPFPPVPPNETAVLFFSSLFWALALVFSVAAVLYFLRERDIQLNRATASKAWRWLMQAFKAMWRGVTQQATVMRHAILGKPLADGEIGEEAGVGKRPFRFIRINGLSPREQIRYFYLSTVRRAAEKGIKRQRQDTPNEYAQTLKEQFPDAKEDVDALTEAFLHARYSPQPIEKETINPIKKGWRHLRSSLRHHRK